MKKLIYITSLLIILSLSCTTIYKFEVNGVTGILVVEGFVSDVSYNDFSELPLDPRYFDVRLKITSPVTNQADEPVSDAIVFLSDDANLRWDYVEIENGLYRLFYDDFKVEEMVSYKLNIELTNGEQYESGFELPPRQSARGEIVYQESTSEDYKVELGETIITSLRGLDLRIQIPQDQSFSEFVYNKWDYVATYGFIAWLNPGPSDPNYKCWVSEDLFFRDYTLAKEKLIGNLHDLFFFNTGTSRIHEGFSVLIRQQSLSENHHTFWQDLQSQKKQSELFSPPPYNPISNIYALNNDKEAYGYFGVVREQFYRWTFSKDMVSYNIVYPESLKNSCNIPLPPPSCFDCTKFELVSRSSSTNTEPEWWQN
jgi:hypothetical protein